MESDGDKHNNENKEELNYENIKTEYDNLKEKSFLYKLKRWEKNLMAKLRKLLNFFSSNKDQKEEIQRQNNKLDEDIKKEMETFEAEKKEIIKEKEESIKKIEIKKKKLIQEDDKKYNDILVYLNTIKNDKKKLIEFLQRKNIF